MPTTPANPLEPPEDVAALRAELAASRAALAELRSRLHHRDCELEKLKLELARLKRWRFGRSSERLDAQIAQLELTIEAMETVSASAAAQAPAPAPPRSSASTARSTRPSLPEDLPREDRHHAAACTCPDCGAALTYLGEDVSEVLEYVPASFKIIRHIRPKHRCGQCGTIDQAPAAERPIERGRAGAGLLAQVLVAKYCDHLPLYRQSAIYAREGVPLTRSTLADWVGASSALLAPLGDALQRHILGGATVHADDTPVPVLAPGRGQTRTARLWTYVRDERAAGGETPPAVLFRYSPDRKGLHPQRHLRAFTGVLQADGYPGFRALYETGRVQEAACWAHVRRKFHDVAQANDSPYAREALTRIGSLYAVEADLRGQPPDRRRCERQARAGPVLDDLRTWFNDTLQRVSAKSTFAVAVRYALERWTALTRYRDDGRVEIDNNAAERALRTVALGRKNYLFAGSDRGGDSAALIYSLIGTARLNGVDPYAYLRAVLERIGSHPINRIDELLPWHIALGDPQPQAAAAAA
ncbi:IS66 family transposase [Spiribacter vilamensis]|uniref:Transposase n=1 Tax=Spiribacter vilamensis TaxID=531306 RepID=A0A4Q8CYX0_9GAMM|nr:IS66 family transposase [Spiribacter vilamensis]RZU98206.1 transposase [Spiribacter vilamensis]TVO60893.1 IS66 family transposase [Spiribacter vilamensis]